MSKKPQVDASHAHRLDEPFPVKPGMRGSEPFPFAPAESNSSERMPTQVHCFLVEDVFNRDEKPSTVIRNGVNAELAKLREMKTVVIHDIAYHWRPRHVSIDLIAIVRFDIGSGEFDILWPILQKISDEGQVNDA